MIISSLQLQAAVLMNPENYFVEVWLPVPVSGCGREISMLNRGPGS